MEDQFDAVLYLGRQSHITHARLSPALCSDRAYLEMRLRRMALVGFDDEADRLKHYSCDSGATVGRLESCSMHAA